MIKLNKAYFNKEEVRHIDSTPDSEYPLRILRTYRENCNIRISDSATGETKDIVYQQMNDAQIERAKILDRAIEILELRGIGIGVNGKSKFMKIDEM